jgi:hypothetical protein
MKPSRKILLIEPGYKNKYPPIGLMKIATYHRRLGHTVHFFKGNPRELALGKVVTDCMQELKTLSMESSLDKMRFEIENYIKTGKKQLLNEQLFEDKICDTAFQTLYRHSQYYRKREYINDPLYDRVYITTLFTFYWNITIKTIQEAKFLVKDLHEVKVGGVMASLLPCEIEEATGIKPLTGLLDQPGILDDNGIIIDDLPLDYSILDEIEYEYPTGSAYFTFMTKGCTRTCSFCSVPKLEPTYKEKIPTIDKFFEVKKTFGEQRNLLLMDNNVLASPKFPEIIQEIKDMGFTKDAKHIEPNQLDIAIRNLKTGSNDAANLNRIYKLLLHFQKRRVKGKTAQIFTEIAARFGLLHRESLTKENLISAYDELAGMYEKYRDKTPKQRYVDFNQGTDARYVTEEYMKLLSEIPIYPLRIAFDHVSLKETYIKAVRLGARYGINRFSNYLLFNFKDRPEDLYNRMKINIDLSEELGIEIYSFPMKYIPLFGEEAKHRKFIGKNWNKKFIRAIQAISNATRGIVPSGKSFFERAFGSSAEEFFELLYMPETYLVFRKLFDEDLGYTSEWRFLFSDRYLDREEKDFAKKIIEENDFSNLEGKTNNKKVLTLLRHYQIKYDDVQGFDDELRKTKFEYDRLISENPDVNLTLTYDFDKRLAIGR